MYQGIRLLDRMAFTINLSMLFYRFMLVSNTDQNLMALR
jgi:hypothetical protein